MRQRSDDGLCHLARVAARGLGQEHGGVARKIAMIAIASALDHEGGSGSRGQQTFGLQPGNRPQDEVAKLVFHA